MASRARTGHEIAAQRVAGHENSGQSTTKDAEQVMATSRYEAHTACRNGRPRSRAASLIDWSDPRVASRTEPQPNASTAPYHESFSSAVLIGATAGEFREWACCGPRPEGGWRVSSLAEARWASSSQSLQWLLDPRRSLGGIELGSTSPMSRGEMAAVVWRHSGPHCPRARPIRHSLESCRCATRPPAPRSSGSRRAAEICRAQGDCGALTRGCCLVSMTHPTRRSVRTRHRTPHQLAVLLVQLGRFGVPPS